MKFSERLGYKQARTVAQVESMDERLRTGLWNVTYVRYFDSGDKFWYAQGSEVSRLLWATHFHKDMEKVPESAHAATLEFKPIFEAGEWHEVYDFIEALVQIRPESDLIDMYNAMLETHLAGYRIVDEEVAQITDKEEIAELESSLANTGKYKGARHALSNALALYSRFKDPDYPNSIKESISAVEAVAREMTGKPNLSAALDQIKRDRPDIHQALITGWKSLYGYASDEPTIRHGGPTAPDVSQGLARYFLITCSSFVNLLIGMSD